MIHKRKEKRCTPCDAAHTLRDIKVEFRAKKVSHDTETVCLETVFGIPDLDAAKLGSVYVSVNVARVLHRKRVSNNGKTPGKWFLFFYFFFNIVTLFRE